MAHTALKANHFTSTQSRYDEYEIQSISLYDGLYELTANELAFYKNLNEKLPSLQSKQQQIIGDEEKLKRLIKDYSLLLSAWAHKEDEMKYLNITVSLEIDLIWRTHLLSTCTYYDDCMLRFGKLINYKNAVNNTSELSVDSEQFHAVISSILSDHEYDPHASVISIDLSTFKSMLSEYLTFITKFGEYNISSHDLFDFDKSVVRYRYFMYLKYICSDNRQANLYLIPTSDVLLLWYTHIIYKPANYVSFSQQLFNQDHMLKYDFFCVRPLHANDVQQTQSLWDSYFGLNSYRDYSFINFSFNDSVLLVAKDVGGEGYSGYHDAAPGGDHAPPRVIASDDKNKGFCYSRQNRQCAVTLAAIGYTIIVIIICLILLVQKVNVVVTLMVVCGLMVLLIFALIAYNQRCCGLTEEQEMEEQEIQLQVDRFKQYNNNENVADSEEAEPMDMHTYS